MLIVIQEKELFQRNEMILFINPQQSCDFNRVKENTLIMKVLKIIQALFRNLVKGNEPN